MPAKFFRPDPDLQSTLESILEETWEAFPQLAQNQIAITWIPYERPYQVNTGGALSAEAFWQYQPLGASYRGVELVDPGALVQLFYAVAMHVWLEQGMAQPSPEIARALTDMLVENNNDATSYVVDVLSGTTSGPAIPAGPFETWQSQRNIVNRYFQQLGWPELRAINVSQKNWSDGPYGREREFLGKAFEHCNQLTTEAVARLLHSIIGGVSVSSSRSQAMMKLLQRPLQRPVLVEPIGEPGNLPNPASKTSVADIAEAETKASRQTGQLIGAGLPNTARLWGKGSIASRLRHDAAYIEAEGIHPYLLVMFTEGMAQAHIQTYQADILPFVSQRIFEAAQQTFLPDGSE